MEDNRSAISGGVEIRKFLVGVVAFVLLIWGPLGALWIRTVYLVAVPIATWFFLDRVWASWRPDAAAEDRLRRTIAGVVGGVMLVGAVLATQKADHFVCTQEVRGVDGTECVGDYIRVPGPDFGEAALLAAGAAFAIRFGIYKQTTKVS
jgi:hypothetical protein